MPERSNLQFTGKHQTLANCLTYTAAHISPINVVVKSLITKAFKICSADLQEEELIHLKDQLINNGYLKKMIESETRKIQ